MKKVQYFISVLLLVAFSIVANAGTISVPAERPTIQAGIDSAIDGDTVLVADGIYTGEGNRDLDFKGKAITVTSENGPENCIIDCEGLGRAFYFHSKETATSIVSGFTITNSSAIDGYIGAICCIESSPVIRNNIITGNYAGGIYCNVRAAPVIDNNIISENTTVANGGGISCISSSPTISNNTISKNSTTDRGGGISCNSSSPVIDNNIISENITGVAGGGISCWRSNPRISNNEISRNVSKGVAGGIALSYHTVGTIINCTIYRNSAEGEWHGHGGGGVFKGSYPADPTIVLNTIIWRNLPEQMYVHAANWVDITYSNIQDGWPGEGNIGADPLFVDAANGDYHLRDDSPCIGAGFEGADMGAHEYSYEIGVTDIPIRSRRITTWGAVKLLTLVALGSLCMIMFVGE